MTRRKLVFIYLAMFAYTFAPVVGSFVSGKILIATGTDLDRGLMHPCLLFGHDVAPVLYDVAGFGFFALITLPTGVITIVVLSAIMLVRAVRAQKTGVSLGRMP